jgi:hypothetical protein
MLEIFSLWFDHEFLESEHYFHLGYNCNEPIILVFEMLRISIVKFGSFSCLEPAMFVYEENLITSVVYYAMQACFREELFYRRLGFSCLDLYRWSGKML